MPESAAGRIPVTCTCGKSFTVEAKYAGRQGRCPKCGQALEVPSSASRECPKCHLMNRPEELFCSECGEGLLIPDPAAAPPAAPPRKPASVVRKTETRRISDPPRPQSREGTRRISQPPQRPVAPIHVGEPPAPAASPAREGTRRITEPPKRPASQIRAVEPPPPEEPAPDAEAPAAEPPKPVGRRTAAMSSKLAEMEKPRRNPILRFLVFLILAGAAGAGTFYGTRKIAEEKMGPPRAVEAEARKPVWGTHALDTLFDRLKDLATPAAKRATPEEQALRATIDAEYERLKKENVEALKKAEAAHAELEKWQLAWYGAIGLAALIAGLIGWKLSG